VPTSSACNSSPHRRPHEKRLAHQSLEGCFLRGFTGCGHGEKYKINSLLRGHASPELEASLVIAKDHKVALVDSLRVQRSKGAPKQLRAKASAAMSLGDSQVINETAPPVMTAQRSGNNGRPILGNETETWVPGEK
jgi:hypothetical protein